MSRPETYPETVSADVTSSVDLVPGVTYQITLNDCCIEGVIVGKFIRQVTIGETSPNDPDGDDLDEMVFDIGRLGPHWGQMTFRAVTPDDDPDLTSLSTKYCANIRHCAEIGEGCMCSIEERRAKRDAMTAASEGAE